MMVSFLRIYKFFLIQSNKSPTPVAITPTIPKYFETKLKLSQLTACFAMLLIASKLPSILALLETFFFHWFQYNYFESIPNN